MLSSSFVVPKLRKNTKRVIIHWFRHGDLRVHDNQPLTYTSELTKPKNPLSTEVYPVIPIFCFDNKIFGDLNRTPAGSLKCGPRRAKFIIESVADLRQQLHEQVGTYLLVGHGDPYHVFENALTQLEKHYNKYEIVHRKTKVDLDVDIVCQIEYATEEREAVIDVNHLLRKICKDKSKEVTEVWGSMLYGRNRSPFGLANRAMPNDFRDFSVRLIKRHRFDSPLPVVENLPFPKGFKSGMTTYMPTLSDLGYTDEQIEEAENIHPTCDVIFRGGETAALARVHEYVWEKNLLPYYKHRRLMPILEQQTSKLSPWLSHGCLSPRFLAAEAERACVNKAERHKYNAMINWELILRDYCKAFTIKHGKYIFLREGAVLPKRGDVKKLPNKRIQYYFKAWKDGQTGYPLVDASMRELKATGWISSRSRMNVASFLFADLGHDWTYGAYWFESQLIDYDVYSNWVNWCVSTGSNVGKTYTRYVTHLEGIRFDPNGEYVKRWVPELRDVPPQYVHKPWKMDEYLQEKYNCRLELDYPKPIRDPSIGELKRKKRFLKRRGLAWPGDEPSVTKKTISKRRDLQDGVATAVEETASKRLEDDWYSDLNNGGTKQKTKWNVALDDEVTDESADEERTNYYSRTSTSRKNSL